VDIVRLARATPRRPIRHPRPAEPEERPARAAIPAHVIERGQTILESTHAQARHLLDYVGHHPDPPRKAKNAAKSQ